MALHAFLTSLVALFLLPFLLLGLGLMLFPRSFHRSSIGASRWFRNRLYGGRWMPGELILGRRLNYWWVPKDVEWDTPDELYLYLLSDRFWNSRLVRIWYFIGGLWITLCIFYAFAVLVVKPP